MDDLTVSVHEDRHALGVAAAAEAAEELRRRLREQTLVRAIFAAAPSQDEFLAALTVSPGIDWQRVEVFQMDEYLGLPSDAPQGFSRYLEDRLFGRVQPGYVHRLDASNNVHDECEHYATLLRREPIDIVCLGIGENGHIAFNDPPHADFHDAAAVKVVELDQASRRQQAQEGCFESIAEVPTHAITVTIPVLMSGDRVFCMVPGRSKREAVRDVVEKPISISCPASILRRHRACTLYLDEESSGGLKAARVREE